ncbi:MAG: hypothetical protein ACPGVG_16130 [Mycobacterium sp.]
MKATIIGIVLFASFFTCCGTTAELQVSNVAPALELATERHDVYVAADATISQTEQSRYLAQSAGLMGAFSSGQDYVPIEAVRADLEEVADRHDAYVGADGAISEAQRARWLRTTQQMRDLLR